MPPKQEPPKGSSGASKKTEKKIQEKIIQDKTFGLKNKNKSKTVQKFCKGVEAQVKKPGQSVQKEIDEAFELKKAQKKKEEELALIASLYKTVETVKHAKDEDPKSILCAYFKQGLCQKGKKCKFSHDLEVEKKTEEIDIYTDQRMQIFDNSTTEDDMKEWDEKKLAEVVKLQEGKYKNQKPTEIICKYFLDAVENRRYGWKWLCPNGMSCIYRHCLPPNYVLKRDQVVQKKDDDFILEEQLEQERSKITHEKGTPVTLEKFLAWKADKKKKKEEEIEKKRKEEAKKTGKQGLNVLSGKALFKYDPTLFQIDDDGAAEGDEYENRSESQEGNEEKKQDEDNMEEVEEEENEENHENNEDLHDNEEEKNEEKEEKIEEKPKKVEKEEKKKLVEKPNKENEIKINEALFLAEEDVNI